MSERAQHRVSTKCAIYSPDGEQVLVAMYGFKESAGLPGGHVEEGEDPDDAMRRELEEELNLTDVPIEQRGFWRHENGKIILGYVALLGVSIAEFEYQPDLEELSEARWVPVSDIASGEFDVGSYRNFVVNNQPRITEAA